MIRLSPFSASPLVFLRSGSFISRAQHSSGFKSGQKSPPSFHTDYVSFQVFLEMDTSTGAWEALNSTEALAAHRTACSLTQAVLDGGQREGGSEGNKGSPGQRWAVRSGQYVATHHFQGHLQEHGWGICGWVSWDLLPSQARGGCFLPSFSKKKIFFYCFPLHHLVTKVTDLCCEINLKF